MSEYGVLTIENLESIIQVCNLGFRPNQIDR
ncbi:MAG: hypothetical protein BMS9Abin02_0942 [Anaerolineae bacterium]|nr:MAG: hypothetical protein BMS9Abin02_0942 [Anaerolineae bacterium]